MSDDLEKPGDARAQDLRVDFLARRDPRGKESSAKNPPVHSSGRRMSPFRKGLFIGLGTLLLAILSACQVFEHSPYMVQKGGPGLDSTKWHNLHKLEQPADPSAPFTFAVIADIQVRLTDLARGVTHLNADTAVKFVLVAGDMIQFGLQREYEWFDREMKRLRVPWITVIGNHEAIANGAEIYRKRYGPLDFTFDYGDVRFITANTNGWEFSCCVPDFGWIETELARSRDDGKRTFMFTHVAPYMEQLDSAQSTTFTELMVDHGVELSIHGHLHRWEEGFLYHPDLYSVVVDNIRTSTYARITVHADSGFTIERVDY